MAEKLARIPVAQIFHNANREAERLGFKLQLNLAGDLSVGVRLLPATDRGRAVATAAGSEGGFIECTCSIPAPGHAGDRIDATRDAINQALELARDSGA